MREESGGRGKEEVGKKGEEGVGGGGVETREIALRELDFTASIKEKIQLSRDRIPETYRSFLRLSIQL